MDTTALYTQIAVMFLLIGVGVICYRRRMVTDEGSAQMSAILVNFVMPCIIVHSFTRKYDPAMLGKLVQAFVLSTILLLISIALTTVLFRKSSPDYADKRLCSIIPNNGFMALPLLQALYGQDGVFIGSINIVATNIMLWTYGVWLLTRASGRSGQQFNLRKIFLNPGTIGLTIGLFVFISPFRMPTVIDNTLAFMGDLNTPLAMIVLGVYLAQSNLLSTLKDITVYVVCASRLIVLPLCTIAIALLLPFDSAVIRTLLVSTSTPCAVACSMFAQKYGTNYRFSSKIIAVSTVISAITMPIILSIAALIFA